MLDRKWTGLLVWAFVVWVGDSSGVVKSQEVFSRWPRGAEVAATLGKQTVAIPPERLPGQGFPDMPYVMLKKTPPSFLMVCGNDTYLWSGNTLSQAVPVAHVLGPGDAGSVDNHYAGIASVLPQPKTKTLVAFYHAEDSEGIGKVELNGVPGYYGSICVAESPMDNLKFTKLGAAITADQPKKPRGWETDGGPKEAWFAQGVGDPTVCLDAKEEYLLCVYNELSNRLKQGRGVQLCVARAPIASAGKPGSWTKYYQNSFSQPGLGGHDTPILSSAPQGETISPHLQYVEKWKRYLLVFAVVIYSEVNAKPPKLADCGIYLSTSPDAVTWSKPVKIKSIFSIFVNGQECIMHPFVVINSATDNKILGQLMYRHTPLWPDNQGYLATTPIQITLNPQSESKATTVNQSLKQKLAGTKWVNSNKASFEWTSDGRFLHQGTPREWKELSGNRVEITFSQNHKDILEFDDGVTKFKQLIRGGPKSFQGSKR